MAIVSSTTNDSSLPNDKREERLVGSSLLKEEKKFSKLDSFRPKYFKDFIGQTELKKVLSISVKAALSRGEALDHLMLYGPPGLGKTTMALVIAEELGVKARVTSAPALERPRDIVGLLINLKPRELIFVDEIHRLNRISQELLYPAMEDRRLDLTVGKGASSRMRSIEIPPFTLVGATTKPAALSSPMRDRFGITQRLDFYNYFDLENIIKRSSSLMNLSITEDASKQLARRSRGTPRIANRLIRRVRDFAEVYSSSNLIDVKVVNDSLDLYRVDQRGLDATDRSYLGLLVNDYGGGPVGVETLAAALREDVTTLETVVEPYLMQIGFLQRTSRGRVVTPAAEKHYLLTSSKKIDK
ncbi:Holliday junction branch migration DNA helicase RuvB [Prochlorococcus marinus]|uniref:Holliday junction branch migration complex subunit RuvB n=1 Tax=Prochlorococcus marinus XMU1408 TaxID=2213228 RepID=A0A318QXZ4_PROMR|nr:Holliday junction branch migration DNA helicase RuvB [Prochlorococcus marinus]MBW3042841.1 Holliday junction branch migration DNA helicase RuvB [Prochlorococcus marinus str. XMU1408]PYE00668.1 Holliday junction branch migration DNA helicase RuvB [Prochlorococcus marinus XMU1408]